MSPRLSEFELIRRYFERPARGAVLGVGDDAALVAPSAGMELAISVDTLNEGVHFFAGADPRALGHKCLAVNLSDMAAMGAKPRWATLALSLPAVDEAWLSEFARGLFALAGQHALDIIGGDTTRGPLSVSITVIGEVPFGKALRRSGARPGDDLWVSGALGGAALGLAVRRGEVRLPSREIAVGVARRLDEPEPRVELGVRLRDFATAAIDISDGFVADLGHILERSGVGARVRYDQLPRDIALGHLGDRALESRCVLSGGDDYELIFTAPGEHRSAIEALAAGIGVLLTRVGDIVAGAPPAAIIDARGEPLPVLAGFDHFAGRP